MIRHSHFIQIFSDDSAGDNNDYDVYRDAPMPIQTDYYYFIVAGGGDGGDAPLTIDRFTGCATLTTLLIIIHD